jgi:hypothetical protein
MVAVDDEVGDDPREVLADLRKARRGRRIADIDPFEALYRAYVTAVVVGVILWLLSGVVGDQRVAASTAAEVAGQGAPAIGLAVGLVLAVGLRSGGRGGPLVIEAAEVRHVLMSPVERSIALRPAAVRQLRFGAAIGVAVGALVGLLAYRRLPGNPLAWIATGAATGALVALGGLGLALVASGRRVGARIGSLLALVVAGWSALDLALGTVTSPASFLGELALWPLRFRVTGLVGVVVPVVAAGAGLALVGGCSIEAAERRATLVGQIRFAATLRDLRTVVVLRRQLAQELPRQQPWVRLPRAVRAGTGASASARIRPRPFPVWRRGWHGILRFPALRFARQAVLGAAAGAAAYEAWRGTTPLLFVSALALYVAALDAVEPIAQELDHPDRGEAYAMEQGVLFLRQTGPPAVLMVVVCAVGWATAVAMSGVSSTAVEVGAVMVVPAALTSVAAALISVIEGPPPVFSGTDSMLPPELAGIRALVRTALPPLVAFVAVVPVLAGRSPAKGLTAFGGAASVLPEVTLVVALVAGWVRYRQRVAAWWKKAMEEATAARRSPPPGSAPARRGAP